MKLTKPLQHSKSLMFAASMWHVCSFQFHFKVQMMVAVSVKKTSLKGLQGHCHV